MVIKTNTRRKEPFLNIDLRLHLLRTPFFSTKVSQARGGSSRSTIRRAVYPRSHPATRTGTGEEIGMTEVLMKGGWGTTGRGAPREEGGWMRGRGYVGQFSRNSMGRDRHSNPRYPRSTLSGSCSLFKQASNSILGSYPFSLTLAPFRFAFLFVSSFPLSRVLAFSRDLSFSLPRYPSFYGSRVSHPSFIARPSLSRCSQLKSSNGTPGFQQLR